MDTASTVHLKQALQQKGSALPDRLGARAMQDASRLSVQRQTPSTVQ